MTIYNTIIFPFIRKRLIKRFIQRNSWMKSRKLTKRRKPVPLRKRDYTQSCWWQDYLMNDEVKDPLSSKGRLFRNRFRVPFSLFLKLVEMAEELGFEKRPKDCCGRSSIPLELKILGTLRVLGRATCFDGIQELTGGSREVHRGFFHEFCEKFVERFYNSYIHPPKNAEEIEKTMEIYRRMGFNGAIGSTDCVHVRWDCCPAGLFNFCKGKEKFPSLVWLATVDHHMKFQSVSRSFYGATNDKTIIKMDKYFKDLRAGEYDLETGYSLFTEFGDPIVVYRPYLLCDPGFLNWEGLLSTYKYTPFVAEASFNAQLESIRKDIERAFGILKARFRCLKNPILLHDQSQIDNMFLTCCILHNLLLSIDGKDKMWQENEQWKEIDKEFDNYDDRTRATLRSRILRKTIDYSYVRNRMINPQGDLFDDERKEDGFYEMRKKVKEHFYWLYKHSYLEWLH